MNKNGFEQEKADRFAERMMGVLNEGAVALMSSIGHRTGLFDTLAQIPPATGAQIAEAAGLNERYVQEWLDGMVVSRVLDYNPNTGQYALPDEHAAFLTRSVAPDNIAMFAQYIPLLGKIEDRVLDCFYNGGGVPYSEYERFVEVMAEDSGQTVVAALLDKILPLAPGLGEELEAGIVVLDVGCGSGRALNLLAQTFPNSRFTGYDFLQENITAAREKAEQNGLSNVHFALKDVAAIDAQDEYDLITAFDAIHDQAYPARVLDNVYRALKPGGVFLMQDIAGSTHVHNNMDLALGPLLYTVSIMHCMTVSLAQDGKGLGTMWGKEKALEMLGEAGFSEVDVHQLEHDFQNYYYVTTK